MLEKCFLSTIFISMTCFVYSMTDGNISPTVAEGPDLTGKTFISGELIFEDNFDSLNASKWVHEVLNSAHAKEFQWYINSTENTYAENSVLHIVPTLYNESYLEENNWLTPNQYCNIKDNFYPINSARLSTKELFSFKYGTLEINARIPLGDWLWPALWMMPLDSDYGSWPASGEIDLMEARCNKNLTNSAGELVGVQQIADTLHWGPNSTLDKWRLTHYVTNNDTSSGFSDGFHVYKLVWTIENITFYFDGDEVGTITPTTGGFWSLGNFTGTNNIWANGTNLAPFDQQFYLIMNLAVGGTTFFSDTYTNEGGKPWNNSSPNASTEFWNARDQWLPTWNISTEQSHFMIDYVRVWAL